MFFFFLSILDHLGEFKKKKEALNNMTKIMWC